MNVEKIKNKNLRQLINLNKLHEERQKRIQNIDYMNNIKEKKKANMYKSDYDAIRNHIENQIIKEINPTIAERLKYLEKFF